MEYEYTGWKLVSGGALVAGSALYALLSRANSGPQLPTTMKRLVLGQPNASMDRVQLALQEVPLPVPKSGEVLVRMVAAPVNPSDFGGWKRADPAGTYPLSIGKEGAGVVVASGGGVYAGSLVGKTVGVVAVPGMKDQGTYQEYITVNPVQGVFPISGVLAEDAASFFVNPYTAVAITEYVKKNKSRSFVHTAAASQLGQMLVQLCKQQGDLTVINVVRRKEQAAMLKELDSDAAIVCQADSDWQQQLKALIKQHDCTVAFDAISGEMTGTLMSLMPARSTTYVYGGLSGSPMGNVETMDLIYRGKKVQGFLLTDWINIKDLLGAFFRLRRASALVNPGLKPGGWATSQFKDCSMEEMKEQLEGMMGPNGSFTGQKLRIRF